MTVKFVGLLLAIALLLTGISGCQKNPQKLLPIITSLRPASLLKNQKIPTPKEEVILTVDGKVKNTNQGHKILMDRQTISSLELIEYKIFDPFEQQEMTFQGVRLVDLINLWQVEPDAKEIELTALNDYQIKLTLEQAKTIPILFAIKQNNEYMQRNYRGPAMLVLPNGDWNLDSPVEAYWIWQISKITFK